MRDLLPQLRTGRVTRGVIGVSILAVTNDDYEYHGLSERMGAIVQSIERGGPADESDLELGDVIVSYDGDRVEDVADLQRKVVETRPGTRIELGVYRDLAPTTVAITIGELDLENQGQAAPVEVEDLSTSFGMNLQDLTAESARELDLPRGVQGAVVTGVEPGGSAQTGGARPGDVITSVKPRAGGDRRRRHPGAEPRRGRRHGVPAGQPGRSADPPAAQPGVAGSRPPQELRVWRHCRRNRRVALRPPSPAQSTLPAPRAAERRGRRGRAEPAVIGARAPAPDRAAHP